MAEHLSILRRVGWVLVCVGLLDIGLMVYCIMNKISYSSSLNIFAVIGGVFLLRGHLGAVRVLTWFSGFMFSGMFFASLLVFPWLQPMEYSLLVLREYPGASLVAVLFMMASLAMLLWVYTRLRLPAVVHALVAAGHRQEAPKSAFLAGGALALFLAVTLQLTLKGDAAQEAIRLAEKDHGDEYAYFVTNIHWGARQVSARLTGYTKGDRKEVAVEWAR